MNEHYKKLNLRRANTADSQLLCSWWNNGQVMAHAGFPKGLGLCVEDVEQLLAEPLSNVQRLIIELEGQAIGEMSYRLHKKEVFEIGIKICVSEEQNKGYGSRSVVMLLKFLFEKRGAEKVVLDTNLHNLRAQYVYERLGFQKVAVHTDAWQDQLGVLQSSVAYEMSKTSYIKRQAQLNLLEAINRETTSDFIS